MTLVKAGKTFLNGPGRRGKEQTETCPILMEQAPLQTRFGNDALLLGEKNCFFPKTAGVLRGYLQNSYYPERPILKIVQRQ